MTMAQKKTYSKNLKNNFELLPSKLFLKQVERLLKESKLLLEKKLLLVRQNPFRNKRIVGYGAFIFRIRLQEFKLVTRESAVLLS